jgi:hypothetical protein
MKSSISASVITRDFTPDNFNMAAQAKDGSQKVGGV